LISAGQRGSSKKSTTKILSFGEGGGEAIKKVIFGTAQKSFVFLFVLWGAATIAQTTDSIPEVSQKITYTTGLAPSLLGTSAEVDVDTTLNSVHYLDPADKSDFSIRNTGNLGSAHLALVCCPKPEKGINIGYNQYSVYRFTKENVRFYRNAHPYTRLNMIIGQRKEQIIEVEHSQNIRKKFNFGFHYMRFATDGAYQRQQTHHNGIAFTTTFDSKKQYLLKTELILNSIRADENGGIKDTGIFEDTSFVTKELVDIELPEAENRRKDIYFHAYQSWSFKENKRTEKTDTFISSTGFNSDTTDSVSVVRIELPQKSKLDLFHEIDIGREKYEFTDRQPDSAYYGLFYHNDSVAHDFESKVQKLSFGNRLGARKYFKRNLTLEFSANYNFNNIDQDGFSDKQFQDLDVNISFVKDTSAKISYGASADYSFLDYRKDDLKAVAFISYDFGRIGRIQVNASYIRFQPAWLYNKFSFEGISWDTTFNKQSDLTTVLSYHLPKYHFRLSAQFHNINGLTYWDKNRQPAQSSGSQQVWVFELRKLFRINYFGFDNLIRVQLVSDNELLRYPIYWGVHSLFYERGVFKGKLLTRVGLDLRYNTNYKAYGYFPVTGQFHLQESETLEFYPVMDVYISFRIQTVRLFLIFNHVNQGLFRDRGYFNAYKYPADDRHFRFGVSWMFLD